MLKWVLLFATTRKCAIAYSKLNSHQYGFSILTRIILLGIITLVISSCAKRPDAIAPTAIPSAAYSNLTCSELAAELNKEAATLATLSAEQNQAASNDAFGVFLIGVPLGSVSGNDKEGLIAVSKGKVQAIEATRLSKRC